MNPQSQPVFETPATRDVPAQERSAAAGEFVAVLPAEQVYAQRLHDSPAGSSVPGPVFVP